MSKLQQKNTINDYKTTVSHMVKLSEYTKLEKVALRNMTITELLEKLGNREEIIRKHYDHVVDSNDNYPSNRSTELENKSYEIALDLVDSEKYEDEEFDQQVDILASDIKSNLTDMIDDLYMIRTQIRERLHALGQTIYTERLDGEKPEKLIADNRDKTEKNEQVIRKLGKHGHNGKIKTNQLVYKNEDLE